MVFVARPWSSPDMKRFRSSRIQNKMTSQTCFVVPVPFVPDDDGADPSTKLQLRPQRPSPCPRRIEEEEGDGREPIFFFSARARLIKVQLQTSLLRIHTDVFVFFFYIMRHLASSWLVAAVIGGGGIHLPWASAWTLPSSSSSSLPIRQSSLFSSSSPSTSDEFTAFAASLEDREEEEDYVGSSSPKKSSRATATTAPRASSSTSSTRKKTTRTIKPKVSWQDDLDKLLDPTTPFAKRQVLLQDLLSANGEIRSAVEAALRDRKVSVNDIFKILMVVRFAMQNSF